MYTCANCEKQSCGEIEHKNMPQNCPMHNQEQVNETFEKYMTEENHQFFLVSAEIEAEGYGKWSRLKETIEFCKKMNYKKLGLAFCRGLRKEAKIADRIFRSHGFEVVSAMCKTGGISKEKTGLPEEKKIHPEEYEPMCNPILQAVLLNEQKTEFNILIGLCVGHDSMFYKYSDAMVTTLITKDRVLAHNPVGALYCSEGYYKTKLAPEE